MPTVSSTLAHTRLSSSSRLVMAEARQENKRQRTLFLQSCMELKGTSNKTLTTLLKRLQGEATVR